MRRPAAALALALAFLPCPAPAQSPGGDPQAGEALASRLCAGCHAVAPGATSPLAGAPPFESFPDRWPPEHLAEALAEGIVVGHGGARMPEFRFDPHEIDDLIAYLETLADQARPTAP